MKRKTHSVDHLFTFGLFALFMLLAMLLVILGANVYRGTVSRMDSNYETRTSLAYLTEKIREADAAGQILVTELEGEPALELRETISGDSYRTYIYYYKGSLRELFLSADTEAALRQGRKVLEVKALEITKESDHIIRFTVTDSNGHKTQTLVHPVSQVGGKDS